MRVFPVVLVLGLAALPAAAQPCPNCRGGPVLRSVQQFDFQPPPVRAQVQVEFQPPPVRRLVLDFDWPAPVAAAPVLPAPRPAPAVQFVPVPFPVAVERNRAPRCRLFGATLREREVHRYTRRGG